MSVRVNLLPGEVAARNTAARQRSILLAAGVVFVAVLGVVYMLKAGQVSDARTDLAVEQAEQAALQSDLDELGDYAELQAMVDEADATIAFALADELSFAGALQDVAAVMPQDAALTAFDLTMIEAIAPEGGELRPVVGRIMAGGETLLGHAPGVEQLLLEFDKVGGFFDVFVSNSTVDPEDQDVSIFTFEVDLGTQALTGRYLGGVPEALR